MENTDEQLAAIGFARNRKEPDCWRAVRLDAPVFATRPAEAGSEPACSRPLARWRELPARSPIAPPYRISRADG
jgi:hypothetical protein